MLSSIRKFGSTIQVFKAKDVHLRLGSSGSIKNMNTLVYDAPANYKEICRINGSIYSYDNGVYQANGWEVSDMHSKTCGIDGWYEFIELKTGGFLVGDISKASLSLDKVLWAYSPDAVVINNGEDVRQCASHRVDEFEAKHPRTFWGITKDNEYVFCTACGRLINEAGLTGDEVREVLKELGCYWGFMNDGGKCSQMMVDGKLVNKTVTGGWYPVRNAIFIYEETATTPDDKTEVAKLQARVTELEAKLNKIRELVK